MQRSLFVFLFLFSLIAHAQVRLQLFVDGVQSASSLVSDSVQLTEQVNEVILKHISEGYPFSGVDSVKQTGEGVDVFVHRGDKARVDIFGLSGKNLTRSLERKIGYLSDRGYPFASIRLDSTRTNGGKLTGKVVEERGPFITNDSSFFYQPIKTNHSFVYQLLDHIPGKPFSESSYQMVNQKISRVSFLKLRRPVDVSFQNQKAKMYLDIEERSSSTFQGVVGLQQGSEQTNVVGSIDLDIQNLFRSGKQLRVSWERFAENSQKLDLFYSHSFFLASKLTPFFNFQLLKQDTTFLKRFSNIGISTFFSARIRASFGYTKWKGTLLTEDEQAIAAASLADFTTDFYSVELEKGHFSEFFQLGSDYAWKLGVGAGAKRIDRNLSLPDSFYDTLSIETNILRVDLKFIGQKRVLERQTIYQHFEMGIIDNDELLNNERYRIGGLHSLRGFNEKFFFADRYLLSRSEFRSFFEQGSYIYVFFDQLFYRDSNFEDTPFGTGLGFSLATSSGQFSFAMALGKSKNQPLDFANIKAHFGYITRF